jgi:hypothetical protein
VNDSVWKLDHELQMMFFSFLKLTEVYSVWTTVLESLMSNVKSCIIANKIKWSLEFAEEKIWKIQIELMTRTKYIL